MAGTVRVVAMARVKTVSAKAGGGTVPGNVPTPTESPVLTQDVEAAEVASTEAAQRVEQLRAALELRVLKSSTCTRVPRCSYYYSWL